MKQTNNAIKFLMAQYRAIFKNANIAMVAAMAAAALASGQANAAKIFDNTTLPSITDTELEIDGTGDDDKKYKNINLTAGASSDKAFVITVASGADTNKIKGAVSLANSTIKVAGADKANAKLDIGTGAGNPTVLTLKELSVAEKGTLIVAGVDDQKTATVNANTINFGDGQTVGDSAVNIENHATVNAVGEADGAGKITINQATVEIKAGGALNGKQVVLTDGVVNNAGTLSGGTIDIAAGTLTNTGTLTAGTLNLAGGTLTATKGVTATNLTVSKGTLTATEAVTASNELNIAGGTVDATKAVSGKKIKVTDGTVDFKAATDLGSDTTEQVNISGGTFVSTAAGSIKGKQITIEKGTFTATTGLNIGIAGANVDVNGGEFTVPTTQKLSFVGTTNLSGGTITTTDAGELVFKGNATINGTKLTLGDNAVTNIETDAATATSTLNVSSATFKTLVADAKKVKANAANKGDVAVLHFTDTETAINLAAGGVGVLKDDGKGLVAENVVKAGNGVFAVSAAKAEFKKDALAPSDAANTVRIIADELTVGDKSFTVTAAAEDDTLIQVGKTLTVGDGTKELKIAKGAISLEGVADSTGNEVKASKITLGDTAKGTLSVNSGDWKVQSLTLTNGEANVIGSALTVSGDLTVTKGALSLTEGASLKVTGNLSTAGSAGKITATKSVIDTVSGGTVTLGAAGLELKNTSEIKLEAADFQRDSKFDASGLNNAITGDANTTISFVNAKGEKLTLSKADFDKLQKSVGTGFKGLFNVNVDGIENAEDGMALGDVSNNAAIEAYEKVSVKQASATAVDNTNKSVGSVEVTGGNTLNMGTDTSLTLNNAKDGKLVYEVNNGVAQTGNVVFKDSGNSLTLAGSGEIGSITVDTALGANGGNVTVGKVAKTPATVTVKGNIGAEAANGRVLGVTVNDKSSLTVNNVYTTALKLGLGSSLNAGTGVVDVSGDSYIDGNVKAGTLKLGGESFISGDALVDVGTIDLGAHALTIGKDGDAEGNGSSSASVFADTLMMTAGSKVFVDPSYKKNASIFVTEEIKAGTNPDDIGVLDGGLFVGKNAAFGYGFDQAEFESVIADYMVGGKFVDPDVDGATGRANALAINKPLTVKANGGIVVDHSLTTDKFNDPATLQKDTLVLGKNAALVLTDGAFGDGKKSAAITFGANGTVTADPSSKVVLVGDFDANDTALKIAVQSTGTAATNADKLKVEYAGGLLTGTYDAAVNGFKLVFQQDKADAIYDGISRPVADAIVGKLKGEFKDKNAAGYGLLSNLIATQNYKAIDAAAHAATYAGAQQAAVAAVTTMADAMFGRVGAVGVEAASISATGSQANGGVWLTPMYKSVDSDGFNAEGASYGADVDLSGVAFGTDTVNGNMRFGAVFNIGSGDAEGKGNGNGLKDEFDYYGFGIYSAMGFGNFALVGDASMTVISHEVEGLGLRGKADTTAVTMGVTGQYTVATPVVDVTPHLGARFIRLNTDSYDLISANGVEGTTDFDVQNVFSVPLGVTLSKGFTTGGWTLAPSADLTIAFNTGDTEAKSNTFTAGKNIGLNTEVLDEVQYGVTLGLGAQYGAFGTSFGINYTGSENTDSFGVNAQARYMF